jgi:YVTN family beta-propeller protein
MTEQTLSLINNTLLSGNGPAASGNGVTEMTYDPLTRQFLLEGAYTNSVVVVNATTDTAIGGFVPGTTPMGLVADPSSDMVYIADEGSNTLSTVNVTTDQVVSQLTVGSYPYGVALDAALHRLFVTNSLSDNVSVINTSSHKVIASIPVGELPQGILYLPSTNLVYVANLHGTNITVFNASTLSKVGSVTVSLDPLAPVYDPVNGDLYVVSSSCSVVKVFSSTSLAVKATISLQTIGVGAVVNPANGLVFLLDRGGFTVVNATTNVAGFYIVIASDASAIAWDPAYHDVYVSDSLVNTVTVISGSNGSVTAKIIPFNTPDGVAYNPARAEMFIANQGSGNVSVVAPSNHTIIRTIYVTFTPLLVGAGPPDGTIFVSGACVGGLAALNGTTGRISACINFPGRAVDPVYDPSNHLLYVSDGNDWVRVVNVSQGAVVSSIFIGDNPIWSGPWEMAIDQSNNTLFVPDYDWGNVSVVNLSTNMVVGSIPGGSTPMAALYDPANNSVWVSVFASPGTIMRFNATTYALLPTLIVGTFPEQMLYDPLSGTVYVANSGSSTVSILNATNGSLVKLLNVGSYDYSLSLDSANGIVFCANAGSNNLTVIDAATNSILGSFPTGEWPRSVAYSIQGDIVAVADQNSASVNLYRFHLVAGPPHFNVSFSASPRACGPVAFNGSAQADGSNGSYLAGNYSALANACSDYAFQQWNSTGGVTIGRSFSSSTTVVVSGNGTLTAWYVWNGNVSKSAVVSFVISPARCGPATFGGLNENNDTSGTFATGNYSASAPACSGATFAKWAVTGFLTLPTLGGNPTTVGVWGNGTLTATYSLVPPPSHHTITFYVSPTGCGPVSFNGTLQANDSSAQFLTGTYPMHALSCSGHTFSQGNFQIPNGRSQVLSTPWANVSVSTNGTLWANYTTNSPTPPVHYIVSFVVKPTACGPISFNGTSEANQSTGSFLSGAYPAVAPTCSGHTFATWSVTGFLTLSESPSVSISVTIQGIGTLTATYKAVVTPGPLVAFGNATITGYPGVCETGKTLGMNVSFTGSAHGGIPPYIYSWNFGDGSAPVKGENSTHSYAEVENESAKLAVTDSSGKVVTNIVPVIFYPFSTSCPPEPVHSTGFSILGLSTVMSIILLAVIAAAAGVMVVAVWVRALLPPPRKNPPSSQNVSPPKTGTNA